MVSIPDLISILSVEKSPRNTRKTTSAMTVKLLERTSPTTPKPTSETIDPSVTKTSEKLSSDSVTSVVSKTGGAKLSSPDSSLSRRAVGMSNV